MKKICIVTGSRADYGLLYWLIKGVHDDPDLELQLVVTGMHLSPEFGLTWKQIEKDGFPIAMKIEMLLSSDSAVGVSKSMGLAQISFAEAFEQLKPDINVLLGDRTEIFAAASASLIAGIPVAHLHGGELTEGAYDDALRHSITKISHLHFTSTEQYRQRVIQMGENPEFVFNVGALGIDSIKKTKLFTREEFEESIGRKLSSRNILVTFHPVTLEDKSAGHQFEELLEALDEIADVLIIFTKPNSDKDGRIIIKMIDKYVQNNPRKAVAFESLGQKLYLSAIPLMNAVVGNSSSGIIEVPAFKIPTVNIGDRQKGRVAGPTVINCAPEKKDISLAFEKAFRFDSHMPLKNVYGNGNTSEKILAKIREIDNISLKKSFYDIYPFNS